MITTTTSRTSASSVIEIGGPSKRYGSSVAVDALSSDVPAGQVIGLLGPNGAGKTTAMKTRPLTSFPTARQPGSVLRCRTLCLLASLLGLVSCADERPANGSAPATAPSPVPSDAPTVPTDVPPVTTDVSSIVAGESYGREELTRLLEAALDEWAEQHDVVGAVALIADGDVTVRAAVGTRSVNDPEPVTVDDEFAVGSITKTLAAAAVLQLQEAGLLSVDDAVGDYVAGVPAPITIRDLLGHTSGYRDPDDTSIKAVLQPETRRARAEQIADVVARGPLGERGTRHTYASVNYLLLDEVIAVATGSTFEEQVAGLIVQPLDMDSSGFEPGVGDLASPHERPGPGQPPIDLSDFNVSEMVRSSGAAGALYSTVDDLEQFIRAVFDGNGFADDMVARLTTPIVPGADYGLGLGIYDSPAGVSYGHNGRIVGYHASMRHDPERGFTAIALSNDGNAPTEQLVSTLLTVLDS